MRFTRIAMRSFFQARDINMAAVVVDAMSLEEQEVPLKDPSLRLQLGVRREVLQSVVG